MTSATNGTATVVRGSIVTMDPRKPRAEAMAVRGERIVAVGSLAKARDAAGQGARELGFGDGAILPGLIDTHNHMFWTGIQSRIVDLSRAASIADIQARIRDYAARHPKAPWIVSGEGWHVVNLKEQRYPTRQELDAACADRPVYLPRVGHAAVANSRALAIAGISRDTPEPAGGRIERDSSGEPTGVLLEMPAFEPVARHVPTLSHDDRLASLEEIQKTYHAVGITGIIDPGVNPETLGVYQDLWSAGRLTMRSVVMPLADSSRPPDEVMAGLKAWGVRTGFGDARLRLGGIKLFVDGGASLGTALMREPHPDERCNCGIQVTSTDMLRRIAHFCAERRWSLGVHVVGGKAIDLALEVFEEVDRAHSIRDLRFCLIHAYLWPSERNIAMARRLGVVVATQPSMQYTFGPILVKRFGAALMAKATPIRDWLDGGVVVGGGSDSPITPFSPLLGLWQATTRRIEGSDEAIGREEVISAEEALTLYTRNGAYLSFAEHERGMLRPGMLADWIALSVDPLKADPDRVHEATVRMTAVGGEVVHGG
ncbi:MAG TPA: amidohydrolase [Alphaproteobacteria bacterium]|nr:amidohydrolase [Alphaproteobacteria bacterium]